MSIADNVARILERIAAAAARAGRSADEITLVAVSKTFPAESIRAAYAAGLRHFGENRAQEWESKAASLADLRDATWHLVGHLQSNKARRAVDLFHAIDSVDSIALARRLDRLVAEAAVQEQRAPGHRQSQNINTEGTEGTEAQRQRRPVHGEAVGAPLAAPPSGRLPILMEVRLAPEETKHGVEPQDLPAVVEAVRALPHLDLRGLMCIPPYFENPEDVRPYFRRLREFRDCIANAGSQPAAPLPALSMGMSHDFEVAIAEGATEIRIGTAIFGERPRA